MAAIPKRLQPAFPYFLLFRDRIEVSSPGDWIGKSLTEGESLSLADFRGMSIHRNATLSNALYRIRLVEAAREINRGVSNDERTDSRCYVPERLYRCQYYAAQQSNSSL